MKPELFTSLAQELINQAVHCATELESPAVTPLHVMRATLDDEFCLSFYRLLPLDIEALKALTDRELSHLPRAKGGQLTADYTFSDLLSRAEQESKKLNDQYISLEHILLALGSITLPSTIQDALKKAGFTHAALLKQIHALRKGKTVDSKSAESQYQVLERYCQNLTQQARQGKLDPVIGRHDEIRRVIQILSRRTKNNPVLIGEPGVGKTAIVEGIAQRIVNNDVPESLRGSTLYALDLGLLIAGAKYQGEFEERLKGVLKEVESTHDHVVLFIDELHMLIGAGGAGGGMDASNLLKPALARGTLHCIGATTVKEYRKYIEKDPALERRFQKVLVEEPSVEDAVSILRGLKERYELHHGIHIKDQALVDAVLLASKYITDRFLPDKAIDLVDEAAAMVKMEIESQPEELDALERTIRQLEIERLALAKETGEVAKKRLTELEKELAQYKEKHATLLNQWKAEKEPLQKIQKIKEEIESVQNQFQRAEREGDYAKASELKYGKLVKLQQDLANEQDKIKHLPHLLIKEEVDEHDIATVLSRWTGIPVEKLQVSEAEKLIGMRDILKRRVIGQDEAIDEITHAIQMHRTGLTDPHRPIGSFLFLGPTGVGKTEVAKTLADFLFNDPKRLIRIDMSEYMEKHTVARLIGAPPGYVGYEEGGQLTEAVRRHPYSVLLFDEIEKAHPDVFNLFLQILDEGHLTDGQGHIVSFKNTIIIMTSNIGSPFILEAGKLTESVKEEIISLLHKTFKPEFLNRIDSMVFFKTLTHEDVVKIAHIQLEELKKRLLVQNIVLDLQQGVLEHLASLGYQPEFGARPLRRAVQQYITGPMAEFLLRHPGITHITVTVHDGTFKLS